MKRIIVVTLLSCLVLSTHLYASDATDSSKSKKISKPLLKDSWALHLSLKYQKMMIPHEMNLASETISKSKKKIQSAILPLHDAKSKPFSKIITKPKSQLAVSHTTAKPNQLAISHMNAKPKQLAVSHTNTQPKHILSTVHMAIDKHVNKKQLSTALVNTKTKSTPIPAINPKQMLASLKPMLPAMHPIMTPISITEGEKALINFLTQTRLDINKIPATTISSAELTKKIIKITPPTVVLKTRMIQEIVGMKGEFNKQTKILKFSAPRDDLKLTVNGATITPEMGLTSWINFKAVDSQVALMGDLILTPDQINPVMSVVLDNGIQVTSLHNNFLWENPPIVVMHVESIGKQEQVALDTARLFRVVKETSNGKGGDFPIVNLDPANSTLDSHILDIMLGVKGTMANGVYKIVANTQFDGDTGSNNWATFVGSSQEAVVNGNIIVQEPMLHKTLSALHKANFYIVGIQEHVISGDTQPTNYVFIHYLGVGNTKELCKGIRTALGFTKIDTTQPIVAKLNPQPDTSNQVAKSDTTQTASNQDDDS